MKVTAHCCLGALHHSVYAITALVGPPVTHADPVLLALYVIDVRPTTSAITLTAASCASMGMLLH